MFQGAGSEARFICLSTDVKPVTAAGIREFGIKAGDIVIETDTGRKFRFDGTAWQPADVSVNVTGSIPEYQWLSTDTPPALGAGDRAFGMEINAVTHAITVKYWTGAAWQEVA